MYAKLDAIIFGATGFTGRFAVQYAVETYKDLEWGIAGRNEKRLKNVLKEIGDKLNKDLSKVPIILADVNDRNSIEEMAKKCKIVLNCCGPYRFYGEVVVKACIENGTHHVDISGEPQYIDKMQLKYHDLAKEKGVYVVPSCGFDSLPAEMGVTYVEQKFAGTVNSVESYWENEADYKDKSSKALLHYGTWESAIYSICHGRELLKLKKKLKKIRIPTLRPKLRVKPYIQKPSGLSSFFLPMHGGDRDLVLRSQRLLYEFDRKRPVQYENYVGFKSFWMALLTPIIMLFIVIMAQCKCTRKILLNYPHIFTCGILTREGPVEANMEALKMSMTFKAQGWSDSQSQRETPRKTLTARVVCYNPFYGFTGLGLLLAAKTILNESDKMPLSGGVLPPGAAFSKTSFIETLNEHKNGLKFEILK